MSNRRKSPSGTDEKPARDNGEVGYGRPPKEHQFRPGRSGNAKGRPKGAKNEATILRDIFNTRLTIREGGRARKISVLEALLRKFFEDALKGNPKSAAFLLNRYRAFEATDGHTLEIDQDDQQILDAYARELEARLKPTGDDS